MLSKVRLYICILYSVIIQTVLIAACNTAGVDVFCIAPGAIDTPMFQASSLNHLSESQRADFIRTMGQGRLIPPQEIADQILFLCRSVPTVQHVCLAAFLVDCSLLLYQCLML